MFLQLPRAPVLAQRAHPPKRAAELPAPLARGGENLLQSGAMSMNVAQLLVRGGLAALIAQSELNHSRSLIDREVVIERGAIRAAA